MEGAPAGRARYRTQSPDTDEWAERILFAEWRRMSPLEKAALLSGLCAAVHRLALAGLAARHPDADEEELELRAACQRLGPDIVERLTGRRLPA